MGRLLLVMMGVSVWIGLAGSVSAESADSARLTIRHAQYGYQPTGKPIVMLQLINEGTDPANPQVSVTLEEAYSSGQNAYHYRKRGATKPVAIAVVPGAKRSVALPVDRLLPNGEYEGIVSIVDGGTRSQERFAFSVSEEDVRQAKQRLQLNHIAIAGFEDKPSWLRRKGLPFGGAVLLIVGLSWGVLFMQSRRDARNKGDR